jgi:hypothetical protein
VSDEPIRESEQRRVADQIFVVSAAMVGVCLTLMGLVAIIASLTEVATITDELLAADAMVFLAACLSSYLTLRSPSPQKQQRYERIADLTFILGMIAIVAIGAIVALRLI